MLPLILLLDQVAPAGAAAAQERTALLVGAADLAAGAGALLQPEPALHALVGMGALAAAAVELGSKLFLYLLEMVETAAAVVLPSIIRLDILLGAVMVDRAQ